MILLLFCWMGNVLVLFQKFSTWKRAQSEIHDVYLAFLVNWTWGVPNVGIPWQQISNDIRTRTLNLFIIRIQKMTQWYFFSTLSAQNHISHANSDTHSLSALSVWIRLQQQIISFNTPNGEVSQSSNAKETIASQEWHSVCYK